MQIGATPQHGGRWMLLVLLVALMPPLTAAQAQAQRGQHVSDTGYVHLVTNLGEFMVVVDDDPENLWHASREIVLPLPSGERKIRIVGENIYDLVRYEYVEPGDTSVSNHHLYEAPEKRRYRESSYPMLRHGVNLMVVTDEASEVYIDGENVGRGTMSFRWEPGTYEVRTVHPDAGSNRQQVTVSDEWPPRMEIVRLYNLPGRQMSRVLGILPGLSQIYQEQYLRAALLAVTVPVGIVTSVEWHKNYSDAEFDHRQALTHYAYAESQAEKDRLLPVIEETRVEMRRTKYIRNALIGLTTALYAFNVFDAWRPPRGGFREKPSTSIQMMPIIGSDQLGVQLSVDF